MVKTVAIYGGSFNPPTLGHLVAIINLQLTNPDISQIIIVPCFAQIGKELESFNDRVAMCRLAFGYLNNISISTIESELHFGGESLSYRLVQRFKEQNPDTNFRFVLGADLKDSYKSWQGSDIIDKLALPIIIPRAGFTGNIAEDNVEFPNVSSTMVRNAYVDRDFNIVDRLLCKEVSQYIEANDLFDLRF